MARPRRSGEQELAEGMRLLDRYTILDRIGSGGMATIYRATDDRIYILSRSVVHSNAVWSLSRPPGEAARGDPFAG